MAKKNQPANSKRPFGGRRMPSRSEVLAFVQDNPAAGKREVARAFRVSGPDRIPLREILKDLADAGLIGQRRKRGARREALPSVVVLTVKSQTADGDLLAEPADWDGFGGQPPLVAVTSVGRGRAPGVGDRVLARLSKDGDGFTASIIRLLDRRPETVLGVVRITGNEHRLSPVDRKQRETVIVGGLGTAKEGDLVRAKLKEGGRRYLAQAEIIETIGSMTDEKAVSMIAIHAHGIPFEFPVSALEEAEAAKSARLTKNREDWRSLPLITIDPPDAKDHDDAVHAGPDPDPDNPGGFIATVAIADVGWFVRAGSPLDREARRRGNSVYFPDRVLPMLPDRLSSDLCSLRVGKDRAALAVRMIFDKDGRKRAHAFHRVLIKSVANLSYIEAQEAFDRDEDPAGDELGIPVLSPLWRAYQTIERGRAARQPLELMIPERKMVLDSRGRIERVALREVLDAHRLIEEFMIQANVCAAETLEQTKSPLVYRIHDAPSLAKLESLREFLESIEIAFPRSGNLRPIHFNRILAKLKETEHGRLLHEVVLRTQSQAEYSPTNIGHFGLNLARYAHFTSPIRRYADLIVHRGLVKSLELGEGGLPAGIEKELPEIAAEISAAERRAMAAERETIDRLVAYWLADRVGATFQGRIAGVTRAGLFVKLDDTGADGFVPMSTIGDEYFVFEQAGQSLVGRDSGLMYRLGDIVDVRLVEVAPLAGGLRFELLSAAQGATKRSAKRHNPARHRTRVKRKVSTRRRSP